MSLTNQLKNQHLMWRAGFGPAVEQLSDLPKYTPKQFYKALVKASEKKPDYIDVADDYLKGLVMGFEEAGRQQKKELDADERKKVQQKNREGVRNLNMYWMHEMVNTASQLREKMAFFWHGHFAATNADYNLTSTYNSVKSGNIGVRFVLDAVVRKSTNTTSWSTNNAMKKSPKGIAPTSPTTKLNIWVCNMGGGILGYAQFPGGSSATDGVVLDDNATGRTGTAAAPFNKGRTATHEVGHWMNLRHIWGDATCGTDQVGDTPTHNTANYGCPAAGHLSTCSGTPVEMTMNYMDYSDDACMYMFSLGQKSRMLAVFASGGPRNSFAQP